MTPHELKLLEQEGYTIDQVKTTINLIYFIADIQEQYLLEFERMLKSAGMYSFEKKHKVKKAISSCKDLVKFVDANVSEQNAYRFGDDSDELRKVIDKWAFEE